MSIDRITKHLQSAEFVLQIQHFSSIEILIRDGLWNLLLKACGHGRQGQLRHGCAALCAAGGFLWASESLRSGLPVFRKELQGPETEYKGMHVRIHTLQNLQIYKYEQTIININSSNPRPTRVSGISRVKGNTLLADCLGWGARRKWYPFPAHHSVPRPTNTSEYAVASGKHHENWERSYSRGLEQAGK